MAVDPQEQTLLEKVGRSGWDIIGRSPEKENVTSRDENNQTVTTQRDTGNVVWVITDGKGHNQEMTVSAGVPNQNAGDVVKPPTDRPAGSATATPAAGLERLDDNFNVITDPSKPAVYVRDPNAPAGTQPFKLDESQTMGDPKTWTPITNPNDPKQVIGLFDSKSGKVAATVPAAAGSKPSDPSQWQPIYRTPGDKSTGIVGQWDPTNNELHAVSQAPDGTQIVTTTNAIYVVDKDKGTSTKVQDITPGDVNKQAVAVGGKVYTFDPKTGEFTLPTNVKDAATVGNSTTLKELVWYDDQGNEVARRPNPNYQEPQTTQGAQSLTARQIQQWNPKTGQWEWVENKGRIVASDALRAMAQQLTGQVVAGDISEDEAQKLITAANAKMTNDIAQQNVARGAASDIIQAQTQGATTGAGVLNQRVAAAQGMLGQVLGLAGQGQSSGGLGGGLHSVPAGLGEALVGGIQGWATELGGGQAVYDTAARLVQSADPQNGRTPEAQAAYGVLTQMLEKYKQTTGQDHPAVVATRAASQSQQQGGMSAPVTMPAAPVQQPMNVAPVAQVPGQNYGAATAYTGGIPPWQQGWTPPGASYSYGGPPPWRAQPGPSFVAPPMAVVPAPVTV